MASNHQPSSLWRSDQNCSDGRQRQAGLENYQISGMTGTTEQEKEPAAKPDPPKHPLLGGNRQAMPTFQHVAMETAKPILANRTRDQTTEFKCKLRSRSPSPFGNPNEDFRTRDLTPERHFRPSSVVLPPDFNMSIFLHKIPGMDWGVVIAERNKWLYQISGGSKYALGKLRGLIQTLEIGEMLAERRIQESRGIGLGKWDAEPNPAWGNEEPLPIPHTPRGQTPSILPKHANKQHKNMSFNNKKSSKQLELQADFGYIPERIPMAPKLADFVQSTKEKNRKKAILPLLKPKTAAKLTEGITKVKVAPEVLQEIDEMPKVSFANVVEATNHLSIRTPPKLNMPSSPAIGTGNTAPMIRTLFDCISFTNVRQPKKRTFTKSAKTTDAPDIIQAKQIPILGNRDVAAQLEVQEKAKDEEAKEKRSYKKIYWNSSFRRQTIAAKKMVKAPTMGKKELNKEVINTKKIQPTVLIAPPTEEEKYGKQSSPKCHFDLLSEMRAQPSPDSIIQHGYQSKQQHRRNKQTEQQRKPQETITKGTMARLRRFKAKSDIFAHPIKGRVWEVDCTRADALIRDLYAQDRTPRSMELASRRLLSLMQELFDHNYNTIADLTAPCTDLSMPNCCNDTFQSQNSTHLLYYTYEVPDLELEQWQYALVGNQGSETLAVLPPLNLPHHNYAMREAVLDPVKITLIVNLCRGILFDEKSEPNEPFDNYFGLICKTEKQSKILETLTANVSPLNQTNLCENLTGGSDTTGENISQRKSCVLCKMKIIKPEQRFQLWCGCPIHSRHNKNSVEPPCPTHGIEPVVAPQICDDYSVATGEGDYTGPAQQELLNDLGIQLSSQSSIASTVRSQSSGKFQKPDNCVFCKKTINLMYGYGELMCGHKCHWDKPFLEWAMKGAHLKCPMRTCKTRTKVRCVEPSCSTTLGIGPFETGCYCSSENPRADNRHADELEQYLKANNGICPTPNCGRHPGYCSVCTKLFSLSTDGTQPNKVYLACCNSYYHRECWYGDSIKLIEPPRELCPNGCDEIPLDGIIDVNYTPTCFPPSRAEEQPQILLLATNRPLPKDRRRIGGRSESSKTAADSQKKVSMCSQASLDATLMPPPSLPAPRRSARTRRSSSISSLGSADEDRLNFDPVTKQCYRKHLGLGCAAKNANHMPEYYNSLALGLCRCPHCTALLLHSEATGDNKYSKCCAKGKVDLLDRFNKLQERTPELMDLIFNAERSTFWTELYSRSMEYNNHVALGQLYIHSDTKLWDKRIYKINGMIEYKPWDFKPPSADIDLLRGQLFTIPPDEAHQRLDEIAKTNYKTPLNADVLKFLHDTLREHHPLAKIYATASEIFDQLKEEDQKKFRLLLVETNKAGTERQLQLDEETFKPVDVKQYTAADKLKGLDIHPGRIVFPTTAGNKLVSQIYLDEGTNVLPDTFRYDAILTGRRGTGEISLKEWSRNIDPILFPLLFPAGQEGFVNGIPLKKPKKKGPKPDAKDKSPADVDDFMDIDADDSFATGSVASQSDMESDLELSQEMDAAEDRINQNLATGRKFVTMAQWFRYMAQHRYVDWSLPHWLWEKGQLAQLYTLTVNNRMEADKVRHEKIRQSKFRLAKGGALLDWLQKLAAGQGVKGHVGRAFFTNTNYRGSKQFYQKTYADIVAMFAKKGQPDLLVTFTMDALMEEMAEMLPMKANGEQQEWFERPDLVCRLFLDKRKEFLDNLFEKEVMGPVSCGVAVIEHQARGLPHIHVLLSLDWERLRTTGLINTPEEYMREYICAEIPDKPKGRTRSDKRQRELYDIITMNNIHTCSPSYCLVDGKCKKHFPKQFSEEYVYSENHYPLYKRRPPAKSEDQRMKNPQKYGNVLSYKDEKGNTITRTNAHVVAYNPYLSTKYKAHINVEYIAGPGCAKYLTKYVAKGADMAFVRFMEDGKETGELRYDEFHQMRLARYMTSMEAFLALWNMPLVWMTHEVDVLDVHGPEGKELLVEKGKEEEVAEEFKERLRLGEEHITQLTAYFEFNKENKGAPLGLTYANCYKKIWYNNKKWQMRKNQPRRKICRLKGVSPSNPEHLAIRILLLNVSDPQSWEDLRRDPNDADFIHPTFVEAAKARGLISDNQQWLRVIDEHMGTKRTLRQRIRWLAVFFANAGLQDPTGLLDQFLATDKHNWLLSSNVEKKSIDEQRQYVLRSIEWFLRASGVRPSDIPRTNGTMETACEHIGLPRPDGSFDLTYEEYETLELRPGDILDQKLEDIDAELVKDGVALGKMKDRYQKKYEELQKTANKQQQEVIETIFNAVSTSRDIIEGKIQDFPDDVPRCIFVTGEGGSGKTWTFNTAISRIWGAGLNFLPMATTGNAADLLFGGQTVHRRLCRACHVDKHTPLPDANGRFAEMLRQVHGILIDEITMQDKVVMEYLDNLFRSIAPPKYKNTTFGGKVVVISGDWKQLLPVVPKGGLAAQVAASVHESVFYPAFAKNIFRLEANMRLAVGQEAYRWFLQQVGTAEANDEERRVQLPQKMCTEDRNKMIADVFPDEILQEPEEHWEELANRAILSPLNDETFAINNIIMDRMDGEEKVYTGITELLPDETGQLDLQTDQADAYYENLIRNTPPGLPEHHLRIKVGAVMMLTRNISVTDGLCNGTRVQIMKPDKGTKLGNHTLKCKILTGSAKGDECVLHPITFEFGGNPKAPHEGNIKARRIQFPLRPGSAMTINKAQGQTLKSVGVLLDRRECFSHGQLYVALSRVSGVESIIVCTRRSDRRVVNIVAQAVLDRVDIEKAKITPSKETVDMLYDEPIVEQTIEVQHSTTPAAFITPATTPVAPNIRPLNLDVNVNKNHLQKVSVRRGDITEQRVSMIVNAANKQLQKGGGVDNAVHNACKPEEDKLKAALKAHRAQKGRDLDDGEVVVTTAFGDLAKNFGVKHIAHAVGPLIKASPTQVDRTALQTCYTNALDELIGLQGNSIAFPCISIGAFHYPRGPAAQAAMEAILNWLVKNDTPSLKDIRIITWDKENLKLYEDLMRQIKHQLGPSRTPTPQSSRQGTPVPLVRASTPAQQAVTPKKIPIPKRPADVQPVGPSATPTFAPITVTPKKAPVPKRPVAIRQQPSTSSLFASPMKKRPAIGQEELNQPQVPKTRYARADIVNNAGHGNCFFYATNLVLLGSDSNLAHSTLLRNAMAQLLRTIVDTPGLYPRAGGFQDRASFLDYLSHNFAGAAEGRTPAVRLRAHANDLQTNTRWASIYDARLAALVTGRTVVMLRTAYDTATARDVDPKWDDDHPQQYDIYFPDGDSFCEPRSPDFSLDNIHDFLVGRMSGAYDETGRWDIEGGQLITRRVRNPIVVWYNGYDHFQTIIDTTAPPPTQQQIQEAIERLEAQEVPIALTQQPAPDFVPMHRDVEVPGANPNVVIDID